MRTHPEFAGIGKLSMINYISRIGNDDTIGGIEEKSTMRTVPKVDVT